VEGINKQYVLLIFSYSNLFYYYYERRIKKEVRENGENIILMIYVFNFVYGVVRPV